MINRNEFTGKAVSVFEHTVRIAGELGHTFVGTEHMIYGFTAEKSNIAGAILDNNRITCEGTAKYLKYTIGSGIPLILSEDDITPHLSDTLSRASETARKKGAALTGTEYLLSEILNCRTCGGYTMLKSLGADIEKIKSECLESFSGIPVSTYVKLDERLYPNLKRYTRNFTEAAWKKEFDPVIGRENETERLIQILTRRSKNNPCLIGEAGVGKTAIVEGLAQDIVHGNVPSVLRNKYILSLDLTSMLAGARYRGDFEERIKNCIDEAKKCRDIILFIDELHTIAGAGAAEGAIDAANILKPELARGDIQIIGATTYSEYRKFIESDNALERRFQPVTVREPKHDELFQILSGIRPGYEKFHSVNIPDEILSQAVQLSEKYIPDRFLPDKAIDIIDEACSHAVIRNSRLKKHTDIQDIKKQLIESLSEKEFNEDSDYEISVTTEDVNEVVSLWTGIPVNNTDIDENAKLAGIEAELQKHIIGQDKAIKKVAEAIRRYRIGLREENKPSAAFMFAGPTGVGKTELAKAVSNVVFDNENSLIKLDMSEYMEQHSVSKLIGSPPGYTGYGECNTLSDLIRKKPYSVILFDEVEKAHPDVLNLLLQITDEGEFHDSLGRITSVKNNFIILTTNAEAEKIVQKNNIGFSDTENKNNYFESKMTESLMKMFRPELLNRMDGIVIFEPLSLDSLKKITLLLLGQLSERAVKIDIHLSFSDEVTELIAGNPETKLYGARPLKRIIADKIENILTENIISGSIKAGDTVKVGVSDKKIVLEPNSCHI